MLRDLPPGQYTVQVWHPALKGQPQSLAQRVDVGGGTKSLLFTLPLKHDVRAKRAPGLHWRLSLKLRFRSFRSRLLFFLIALLTLLQCAIYLLVRQAIDSMPWRRLNPASAPVPAFSKLIQQRNQQITTAAAILSRDHAFQEAFAGADQDRETTLSALASLRGGVRAEAVLIASLDNELLFDTRRPQLHNVPFPFPELIEKAETNDGTYAFVVLDRELYAIAVAPLLAPDSIGGFVQCSASTTISRVKSKSTPNSRSLFSTATTCLARRGRPSRHHSDATNLVPAEAGD